MIVDAQIHLWKAETPDWKWVPGREPQLPEPFTIERLIAEDDHVVLIANGTATAKTGRPYNNSYCIVARFTDGKIVAMTDYIDTELITSALLP